MKSVLVFAAIFVKSAVCLSWMCNYPCIDGPVDTHLLYKEDNVNEVKWVEKYSYCSKKADPNVYPDAGEGKCLYSRDICIWENDTCVLNPGRTNDKFLECRDLLAQNTLVCEE